METTNANTATEGADAPLFGPGLGETQRAILLSLKQHGPSTQGDVGRDLHFAAATLREHLRTLTVHGFVERQGTRHGRRGRPEVIYALTRRGQALFPHREASMLRELVDFLTAGGHGDLLERYFDAWVTRRRKAALARVAGLAPSERFAAVARILAEEGYMPWVGGTTEAPTLRLCHCPLHDLVTATRVPCRYEHDLLADLLGSPLERLECLADGQPSCTYRAASTSQPSVRSIRESSFSSARRPGAARRLHEEHAAIEAAGHAHVAGNGRRGAADHHR